MMTPEQIEGQVLGHTLALLLILAIVCVGWIAFEWRLSRLYRQTRASIERARQARDAERREAARLLGVSITKDGRLVKPTEARR